MPRYEYECENGHKELIKFSFTKEGPPRELPCMRHIPACGIGVSCGKMLKRKYSTFSFTMI